jgi:hypothetical protein
LLHTNPVNARKNMANPMGDDFSEFVSPGKMFTDPSDRPLSTPPIRGYEDAEDAALSRPPLNQGAEDAAQAARRDTFALAAMRELLRCGGDGASIYFSTNRCKDLANSSYKIADAMEEVRSA